MRWLVVPVAVAASVAAVTVPALGAFPGADPAESPRLNTPNDPDFDPCEGDDAEPPAEVNEGEPDCDSYFSEQFGLFGFRPDSAQLAPGVPTTYPDCSQLDGQGRQANAAAGDPECSQISGVRADTAWKYSTGSPDTVIAILDTGIRWQDPELVDKIHLNRGELPEPHSDGPPLREGVDCADPDADAPPGFNVADFACDPRVRIDGGDSESDDILDASDLIAAFSDGTDADGNGYVDDIAGWDFFDDDNNPFDASSCCSAGGHGTGRAREAAAETDNGRSGAGICPDCQIMPLRVWDTFVVDTNLYALGTVYAADNGAAVVEGAVGGLLNSSFARRSFAYADSRGVSLMLVSSDINSANHNYPTNYDEAVYVGGSLPDTAPGENCETPGDPAGVVDGQEIPGCRAFLDILEAAGIPTSMQPPTTSFFRNSNLTQYGGKADIVLVGSTGSQNTGQAAGAAGLLASYGRERLGSPLTGNEIRQLLTMTAEDVLPANTGSIGLPDRANPGWDSHFGYGRVNLAGAMERIRAGRIPPEAQLDGPDWFTPINVDRVGAAGMAINGRVAAPHGAVGEWRVEYACGQDALDSDFLPVRGASGTGARDGQLGSLSRELLTSLADTCDGQVRNDAGRPAGAPGDGPWPADPHPDPDPERHAFQIRLTAEQAGDSANFGRYRKTLFAYRDDGNLPGWPRPIGSGSVAGDYVTGSGGESSPRFVDLNGDDRLEILLPTSSGELHALRADGTPLPSFNGGRPVRTRPYAQAAAHAGAGGLGEGLLAERPREPLRVPVVGDVTGDGDPEVLVTGGERMYGWTRTGRRLPGFPKRIDPALSEPCIAGVAKPCFDADERFITEDRHIKRGFFSSPALADLDGDGRLDVVAGSLDQHVYAWNGDGEALPGFPRRLDSGDETDGAEIVTSPTIADLDGDGDPEVVIATNEVVDADPGPPGSLDLFDFFVGQATGNSVTYAIHGDGTPVEGWPVKTGVLAGDLLPLVLPAHDAAAGDLDPGREGDEVSISAATGGAKLVGGDGQTICSYSATASSGAGVIDPSLQLNLADYPSIGRLSGSGPPAVVKGGLSLLGVANLLAVNQNLPFNHTVQAWDPTACAVPGTPAPYLPGFPRATDDFQLLSQPIIAKVDGAGQDRHALVGTGLYQLHAYGPGAEEPPGWPKFTGGWTQPMPTVGDVDGDGKLEVMALTREGWAFLWRTAAPECRVAGTTTNAEWWTFHHDEHGTANYGTDARPPSRPGRLDVERLSGGRVRIVFDESGDDLRCGRAERYEVAGARSRIDSGADFQRASRLQARREGAAARAAQAGGGERITLTTERGARFRHLAVRAVDDAGNRSYVRGVGVAQSEPRRGRGGGDGRAGAGGGSGGSAGEAGDESGGLPFTGLTLALLAAAALALLLAGRELRRRAAASS